VEEYKSLHQLNVIGTEYERLMEDGSAYPPFKPRWSKKNSSLGRKTGQWRGHLRFVRCTGYRMAAKTNIHKRKNIWVENAEIKGK